MDHDSDTEIELAIDPAHEIAQAQVAAAAAAAPPPATTPLSAAAAASAAMPPPPTPTATSTFAAPPVPEVVSDLALIQQMVDAGEVVGALPPLAMTAAEKRREVEASLAAKKQARAMDVDAADSDSSSEFESSSDDDDSDDGDRVPDKPMTAEEHAEMKSELDRFMGTAAAGAGSDDDSDSDSGSDLDDLFARTGMEFMDDSEDEGEGEGGAGGGVIMSVHEQPLPPVAQPPVNALPEDVQLIIAGDVVSWMKEKAVETWLAKKAEKDKEATSEAAATPDGEVATPAAPTTTIPKFSSAGTIVIRAMQAPGEGWLEEGSVLCLSDRRILGTVCETFGPLTSPFYSLRLPPPPYPYPSASDLATGTKIYYPAAATYRKFVDMHAVRDPRFASDASNVFDEEVGDDEVEWSDDEAEAASKRKRKQKKRGGSRAPSLAPSSGHPGAAHPLPARPHFDYAGDDDMASLHGGDDDDRWDGMSDAGSTMSTASHRALVSYDDMSGPGTGAGAGAGGGAGGDRRIAGRGGRGGAARDNARGGGRGRGQGRTPGPGRNANANSNANSPYPLPQRPGAAWAGNQASAAGVHAQGNEYQAYEPAGYSPQQPQLGMNANMGGMNMGNMGNMNMGMGMGMPLMMGMPMGMPMGMGYGFQHQQQHQQPPQQHQQQQQDQGNAPAINPRFAAAAQYQMMQQMQQAQAGGYWNQNQNQNQGGQQGGPGGSGGAGGQGYSE